MLEPEDITVAALLLLLGASIVVFAQGLALVLAC